MAETTPRATPRLTSEQRAAAYRLVAELLLYPEDRNSATVDRLRHAIGANQGISAPVAEFLASARAHDLDEYLTLLELTPPCPLYLGAHLFEEPSSCRGAGVSERNGYMLELKAIYAHFGFELSGAELADYLPLVAEFLALSLDLRSRDGIGLRRRLLEQDVLPALPKLAQSLRTYQSPYALVVEVMHQVVADDLAAEPGPAWGTHDQATELPVLGRGVDLGSIRRYSAPGGGPEVTR